MTTENQTQWKLVPVEPTEEMLKVEVSPMLCVGRPENLRVAQWRVGVYKAMLAAAPQPPALGEEPEVLTQMRELVIGPHPSADEPDAHDEFLDDHQQQAYWLLRNAGMISAHVARLQAEVQQLNADLVTFKGGISALGEATKKLVLCARTTGGTAGTDQGLMDACLDVERTLSLVGVSQAIDWVEGLQAEVERLTTLHDADTEAMRRMLARNAELEGLLRKIRESGWTEHFHGAIDAALAEGKEHE